MITFRGKYDDNTKIKTTFTTKRILCYFSLFLQHLKNLLEPELIMEWSGEMRKLICLQRNLNKNKPVNYDITLENNKKDTTACKTHTKCFMPLI